nr:YbaB/EbfC family nucleoid-associated protein [Nocardia transvalensis]
MQTEVDSMLDAYQRQLADIDSARENLAATTVEGWSSDNLVRVTSNAAGVPVGVYVDPAAFKRSTPEKLGAAITEAAQVAARAAQETIGAALAPVLAAADRFQPPHNPLGDDIEFRPVVGILPPLPSPQEVPPPAPPADEQPPAEDEDGPHWKGW